MRTVRVETVEKTTGLVVVIVFVILIVESCETVDVPVMVVFVEVESKTQ